MTFITTTVHIQTNNSRNAPVCRKLESRWRVGKPKNFDGVHEMGGGFVTGSVNATNVLESNCNGRVSDYVYTAKMVYVCVDSQLSSI